VTDPTTPSADTLRQYAAHYRELAASRGCVADCLTCARDLRAAAALDAEAARLEREASATTHAELDAAVEAALGHALNAGVAFAFDRIGPETRDRLYAALIAAAEARGAAKERERECVWRYEDYLYSTECGARQEYHTEFCPTCGGRVRVEGA
jgi:bacterioferritin-associated ferredoxin